MKNSTTLKARSYRQKALLKSPISYKAKYERSNQNKVRRRKNNSMFVILVILIILLGITCFLRKIFFLQHYKSHHNPLSSNNLDTSSSPLEASEKKGVEEQEIAKELIAKYPLGKSVVDYSSLEALLDKFQSDFEERYGSTNLEWLDKAVDTFGSLETTAKRLLSKKYKGKPFVMAFAGYSVTVGRGNYFNQSFPFVLKNLLEPIFQKIDIELIVRNAAIGGIPSFPYAFCFPHFLGTDADVISWDYSMNEGKGSNILESYIRLSQQNLPNRPMLIVLDNNKQRQALLHNYAVDSNSEDSSKKFQQVLMDGIVLHRATDFLPKSIIGEEAMNDAPLGFQNWNEFGAPRGCPGKSSWHPKQQEHTLLGYILAKHFVKVIKRAIELMKEEKDSFYLMPKLKHLPPPQSILAENPREVSQLLYGHEIEDVSSNSSEWELNDLSCRTSFLPAQDHEKVLPSIIVNGLNAKSSNNIMQDRPDSMYAEGWVLDVSKIERDTKKKVERCGGLGYIDMKIALYGIPQSGKLTLWLPYEGPSPSLEDEENASNRFHSLILCEANEKRDDKACRLYRDLLLSVGGVKNPPVTLVNGAGVYLNRPTCVSVEIPPTAIVTSFSSLPLNHGIKTVKGDTIGLLVEIQAASNVSHEKGACCISHV
eukprot:CAMPEP_0194190572 /NCGR_PEP_ID=MMETSP0154-20130528/63421_1 /TAXON_ID=1049557 /ORGANISM="Thalassiothrix antarctica, Strain L6-D1" /LENGTH=650 /DNA_ID=CAMNT_0038912601 /DNA_START=194 /DNA_END=2142 /DNA_ORIENTATION=-